MVELSNLLFLPRFLLLPEIWDLSDANKNGALNQDGFDLLLRLIAQCQSGQVIPSFFGNCVGSGLLFVRDCYYLYLSGNTPVLVGQLVYFNAVFSVHFTR